MKIIFDFEGSDEGSAFFALYAGLRMYHDHKEKDTPEGMISFSAAEAYCMLQSLKDQHEKEYYEAAAEYEHVYK